MRTNPLSLALLFSLICLRSAIAQTEPEPEVLPGSAHDPQQATELVFVVPKERNVTLNLVVDRPPIPRTAQFKLKRSGEVLAETSQARPERLEFEVMIEGPVFDLPVYLPVSEESRIHAVYAEHGETNPDLVVETLAQLGVPDVSVIAMYREHSTERHAGARFEGVDCFETWTPFYRVAYKEAAIPPLLVKIPRADCELYRLAARAGVYNLHHACELSVLTISQGNFDWPRRPCPCRDLGYADCRCPNPGSERPYANPNGWDNGANEALPVDPAPAGPPSTTPDFDDPFSIDPS